MDKNKLIEKLQQTVAAQNQELEELRNYKNEAMTLIEQLQIIIITFIPGTLYWKNIQGVYQGCNNNMAKILGLKSPRDIVGKTAYDLISAKQALELKIKDAQIMQSQQEYLLEEYGFDINGSSAVYLTKKVPLIGKSGQVIGLLGTSIDITQRKVAEEKLSIAMQEAKAASLAKSEFLMNMSHDLRTPFSGILSLTNFMHQHETDPQKKELQNLIVSSARRFLALLDDIMEFSLLGSHPVEYRLFNIKRVTQEIVELVGSGIKSKGLNLTVSCPSAEILSDPLRITRILLNLLANAIKFTHQGTIQVIITIEAFLIIIVHDSGIGIPEDKLDIIFDRFSKLTPSNQHADYRGTGLGLYIVKQFVEELGGTISVTSQLNQGSCFTVKLPLTNSTIS